MQFSHAWHGYAVVVSSRQEKKVTAAELYLRNIGIECISTVCNVRDKGRRQHLVDTALNVRSLHDQLDS
jgi:hypothetical protein